MATCRGGHFKKNKKKAFDLNLALHGKYTCEYCDKAPLFKNASGITTMRDDLATIDHIIPLSLNGSNGISNMKVVCRVCNQTKGCKLVG